MIQVRKSEERGHADHGWLNTYHTFSFADYYDPRFMGFRDLRVINEDFVSPGKGFPTHPHRDMEIVTYILEGALEHKDSMGTGSVIRPGDVQRMSAGTGVLHSEFNHSDRERVHLLQIWLLPGAKGIVPSYEQKHFPADERKNRLRRVASPEGSDGAITVHQNVELYASLLDAGKEVTHSLKRGRAAWLQLAKGEIELNGKTLSAGDGAAVVDEPKLNLVAKKDSEFVLFDLA